MRTKLNLGLLLPSILLLLGGFLIYGSIVELEWYRDIYLIVGATVLSFGLMMVRLETLGHFSTRSLEHHARKYR